MPKGRTNTTQTKRPWRGKTCKLQGCDRRNYGHGWCNLHYGHWRRGLTPGPSMRPGPKPAEDLKYGGAHWRVFALWGKADQYNCIQCDRPAKDWAYDGTDPEQRFGETWSGSGIWSYYSAYPEFYMPMCRRCHLSLDGRRSAGELREYREWKHRTGLTLPQLEVKAQEKGCKCQ